MITKSFGQGKLKLPAIGQGLGDYKWKKSQAKMIRFGIDLGMNFLDTAEEYDDGRSEEVVGEAIKGIRDKVIIATKFSPQHNSHNEVLKSVEESLRRLKTDYIDICQIHWPNPDIPIEETLMALQKLLTDGKIRFVGVCNFLKQELEKTCETFSPEKIITLQSEYNLFDRFSEKDALPYCTENEMGFLAYSPLDKGRLGDTAEQKNLLNELGRKYGKTPSQIALNWLVSHRPVVAIPKSTTKEHIIQNAEAGDFEIDKSDIEKIGSVFERRIEYITANLIKVSPQGEGNRSTYYTVKEAVENKLGFVPSPGGLSQSVKMFSEMKPVRLIKDPDSPGRYILVEGRIRFWAWVIAFGNKEPLPAYIREGWQTE